MSDEQDVQPSAAAVAEPLTVEVALRWGDQDSLGHVNNVQIARIVEEARIRAMDTWLGEAFERLFIVLARQEIEFVSVMHYAVEPVRVEVWISRIGTSSVDFGCRLLAPTGQIAALAETTLTAVDPSAGRPVPLPDSIVEELREHLADPVPLRRRR